MEKVSDFMRKGKTYSDLAVYIPYEDGVMKGHIHLKKEEYGFGVNMN